MTQAATEETTKPKLDDLTFAVLKIPRLIPEPLVESVKHRSFSVDQFYKYQESQIDNPYNFLYVLIDPKKVIKGYLWAEVNALDGSLFINTFSIDKEYWDKGEAIDKATEFLRGLKAKTKAPRVYWITSNEKFFVKHGFKRSKNSLMEYNME